MDPWQEAGSKGLDTWFELPAGYAATTDGHAGPVGTHERPSPPDHEVVCSREEAVRRVLRPLEAPTSTLGSSASSPCAALSSEIRGNTVFRRPQPHR
jgi:hypothetical protein